MIYSNAYYICVVQTRYLSRFAGKSCRETTRRIMRAMASNNIWSLYSMKGQRTKLRFREMVLLEVIVGKKNLPLQYAL